MPIAVKMLPQTDLESAHREIAAKMANLSKLFVPGMKLTFFARLPGHDECHLTVTEDDPKEVAKILATQD